MEKSICIILPNYITRLIGGAELQSYFLAEELLLRGWNVEIISSYSKPADKYINPQYANPLITFYYYKQTAIISFIFFKVLFYLTLIKAKYIYVRTDYPHVGAVGFFCRLTGRKMIYACADNECFFKNRYSRQLKRSDYNSPVKYMIRKIDWFVVDQMISSGKKAANYLIAQTSFQKEQMLKEFGKNCNVIPNSFKTTNFEDGFSKEDIVLWVGNLRSIKQPELFLKLYESVLPGNYRFVIIGEKDKQYADFPKHLGLNFEYLGKLSLEETEKWIARARYLVNTSSSEGFSNTFIQAWFFKTFILSLNADPDLLFSQHNLGWCAQGNFNSMVSYLESLMKSPDQVNGSLDNALAYAKSKFSAEANVNSFEKLISN